jgi:hypothetical protein
MPKPKSPKRIESAAALADAIHELPSLQPLTDAFTARWKKSGRAPERADPWYRVRTDLLPKACEQQRHWIGWLDLTCEDCAAEGKPLPSARNFYQRGHNPQMFIYLAEASGLDPGLIERAAKAALAESSMPSMAKAIRALIPWEMVEAALLARG